MTDVNLKRFVDINIQPHITKSIDAIRDTIALFTYEGTESTVKEFSNLAEVTYDAESDTYKYLKVYFDNGGIKAKVYEGINYSALTKDMLKSLPNELIAVACVASDENVEACYTALKTLVIAMNADTTVYGINEKFIIARTKNEDIDTASVKNFAVKFSSQLGAEMTIAAYVSQTDINATNSIHDYAFTEEILEEENITDELYDAIQTANMNVDIELANAIRNCGGNCKNGYDLINSYVRIILHQTLTAQLIELLTQKIKSSDGTSKLYAVISQELEKYKNCGYLTTDKMWADKPIVISYNHHSYTIINKGDALLNGYIIKILPMTSLTEEDKAKHSTPPIYVIIADQYGIRKITINGEVI